MLKTCVLGTIVFFSVTTLYDVANEHNCITFVRSDQVETQAEVSKNSENRKLS